MRLTVGVGSQKSSRSILPPMSQPRPDFLKLSVAERIQLAEDIWDSISAESPESAALTSAQLQAVQARLQEHALDPATAVPWDQVRAELFQRNYQCVSSFGLKPGLRLLRRRPGPRLALPDLALSLPEHWMLA
ncbi:addiction module protein [Xanthomonas arboricola]